MTMTTAITTTVATPKNKPYLFVNEDTKTAIVFTDEVRSSDIASYTEDVLRLTALGYKLQSVEDRGTFMNPTAALRRWLDGKFDITIYGLEMSEDDLSIPQRLADIRLALDLQMKPKAGDYLFAARPPVFETNAAYYAKRTLSDVHSYSHPPIFDRLRVGYNSLGHATRIVHSDDYTTSVSAVKDVWDEIYPIWAVTPPVTGDHDRLGTRIRVLKTALRHGGNREVVLYDNGVEIGCQRVSRAAMERVALELGWLA